MPSSIEYAYAANSPPDDTASPPSSAKRPPSLGDKYRIAFRGEFNPLGPTMHVLVEELARRAAHMQLLGEAHGIMASHAEKATATLLHGTAVSKGESSELARACALANERTEAVFWQGVAASKLFASSLRAVERLQSARLAASNGEFVRPDPRFATESACLVWLAKRFAEGLIPCPRCKRAAGGSLIAARRAWECGDCKSQTGLRSGTVMQASSLPLVAWFNGIRILLLRPSTSSTELAHLIAVKRVQTVAQMQRKIANAMSADTASTLLAGLDELYIHLPDRLPEPSVGQREIAEPL